MSLFLVIAGFGFVLVNNDLSALALLRAGRLYTGSLHSGVTYDHLAVAQREDLIEHIGIAFRHVDLLDADQVAFLYLVLLSTIGNNRAT